jgi:hypothetical protein
LDEVESSEIVNAMNLVIILAANINVDNIDNDEYISIPFTIIGITSYIHVGQEWKR